jgi:hypothetical protein
MPNAASCSRVRSNPILTPRSRTWAKSRGSGAGEGGGAVPAGDADRVQSGRAVSEGRHERTEHDLVRPVPQEVAQQPRRELGRGQLQRHHGQAEQQRDDRDHRAGDPEEQRPRVIRGALEGQRRPRSDPDRRQHRPRGQGRQHRQRRQHPQRPAHIFPQCTTTHHAHLRDLARAGRPADPFRRTPASPGHSLAPRLPGVTAVRPFRAGQPVRTRSRRTVTHALSAARRRDGRLPGPDRAATAGGWAG